jgi:putative transposase
MIAGRDVACNVSKGQETKNEKMSAISPKLGSLATIIRSIKSAVTNFAHQNQIRFDWQYRFHDRIIRNQEECNRIADYMENNILLWAKDIYNK